MCMKASLMWFKDMNSFENSAGILNEHNMSRMNNAKQSSTNYCLASFENELHLLSHVTFNLMNTKSCTLSKAVQK